VLPVDKSKAREDDQTGALCFSILSVLFFLLSFCFFAWFYPSTYTFIPFRTCASSDPLLLPNLKSKNYFWTSPSSDATSSPAAHPKQQSLCTDQDAPGHVDEAGPRDQFITKGGRTVSPNATCSQGDGAKH
jgi:hypothetical protein